MDTKQLAHDQPKRRAQAGWVALAQADQFISIELKQHVRQLNAELQKYKQMSQHAESYQIWSNKPQTMPTHLIQFKLSKI